MKKLFKHKAFRISFYVVIALLGMLITFAYGTFKPNYLVKEKLKAKYESSLVEEWNSYGFIEPSIEYSTNLQFVKAVGRCIDFINLHLEPQQRVHRDIIIAMAVLETGYGTSRFAHEANNLFGIRTWDLNSPHVKPLNYSSTKWAVKKYETKCHSVQDMMRILNNLHFYEKFRDARSMYYAFRADLYDMVDHLEAWSTNPDYTVLVKNRVKHVSLID